MISGLRIGYVMGTGDAVPQSLENIGTKVEFLSPTDLSKGDLAKYDEIVLGVRAYAARPELATNSSRLLEYVKNGGVVVVQYNTAEFNRNYGPYPYELSTAQERTVTDETSHIDFLDPKDPGPDVAEPDYARMTSRDGSKSAAIAFWFRGIRTTRHRLKLTILNRIRRRADWSTHRMGAEFTSMWPLRFTGNCLMASPAPTGCSPIC